LEVNVRQRREDSPNSTDVERWIVRIVNHDVELRASWRRNRDAEARRDCVAVHRTTERSCTELHGRHATAGESRLGHERRAKDVAAAGVELEANDRKPRCRQSDVISAGPPRTWP